jgi:hypothetical protein
VSVHTGLPLPQASAPTWQTAVGVQVAPSSHAAQLPARHTKPSPHGVPSPAAMVVSTHSATPLVHETTPR